MLNNFNSGGLLWPNPFAEGLNSSADFQTSKVPNQGIFELKSNSTPVFGNVLLNRISLFLIALIGSMGLLSSNYSFATGKKVSLRSSIECTTPETPTITPSGTTTFCSGNSVTLSAPAGFSYLWSNGETTQNITVNQTGNYTVQTIAGGCTSAVSSPIAVYVISTPTKPTIVVNGSLNLCTGGSVTLSAPVGYNYLWSNGATTKDIVVAQAGTYTVQIFTACCSSEISDPVVISVTGTPETPTITASGPTTFCAGSNVTLQGPVIGAGNTYLWSNGATTQNIQVNESGTYTLQVIAGTCTSEVSNSIEVTVNPVPATPTITQDPTTTLCSRLGLSITLQGPTIAEGQTYLWSNGATTQNLVLNSPGNYSLRVIANGCTSNVSNTINVADNCTWVWTGVNQWTTDPNTNWFPKTLPPVGADVLVQSGTLNVNSLTGVNYSIRDLTMANTQVTLNILSGAVLNIAGNANFSGLSNSNGNGEVNFIGGTDALISRTNQSIGNPGEANWNIGTLRISNSTGLVTLNGLVRLSIWTELILMNGSEFDLNGKSVTLKARHNSTRVTANLNMKAGNSQLLNTGGFWCEVAYPKSPADSAGRYVQTTAPVQGLTVNVLDQSFRPELSGRRNPILPNTYDPTVAGIFKASGSYFWYSNNFTTYTVNKGFNKPINDEAPLPLGKGIRAFIRKLPADNGAFGFKGQPFTGNSFIIEGLTRCTNNCATPDQNGENGLNFVGNPLAATISWGLVIRNNVEEAIYRFDESSGSMVAYVNGIGTGASGDAIPTGQGFFVVANSNGASLSVPQTAVIPASTSTHAVFRSGAIEDLLRIHIKQNENSLDEIAVRLKEGSTNNFDSRYDARKFAGNDMNIATIAEDGKRLAIDARPSVRGVIRIPLVMNGLSNLSNEELVFTGIESFSDKFVYLNHPSFNAPIRLAEGQRFVVTQAYANGLEVLINNSPLSLEEQLRSSFSLFPNPVAEVVNITGVDKGSLVRVLSIEGKEVNREALNAEGTLSIKALPQGLYFIEVNGVKKTFVKQ